MQLNDNSDYCNSSRNSKEKKIKIGSTGNSSKCFKKDNSSINYGRNTMAMASATAAATTTVAAAIAAKQQRQKHQQP